MSIACFLQTLSPIQSVTTRYAFIRTRCEDPTLPVQSIVLPGAAISVTISYLEIGDSKILGTDRSHPTERVIDHSLWLLDLHVVKFDWLLSPVTS